MREFLVAFGSSRSRSIWFDSESGIWCEHIVTHWPRLGDLDDLLEIPMDEEAFEHG